MVWEGTLAGRVRGMGAAWSTLCWRLGESGSEWKMLLLVPSGTHPQGSQEKCATGGCRCRDSGMCPWPSRPSKLATRRDSGKTS